jgi:hypothetical protein
VFFGFESGTIQEPVGFLVIRLIRLFWLLFEQVAHLNYKPLAGKRRWGFDLLKKYERGNFFVW